MPHEPTEFEKAFEAHAGFVWRSLARLGVADRDVEDVSQEVFLIVLRRMAELEGRSSLRTWIYGVCRGVAANYRRRAGHTREVPAQPIVDLAGDAASVASAEAAFESRQSRALLEALLARLPVEQREVLVLYEIEELTMREIADALECSQNTAFSRLYAARSALAAMLKRLRAQRRVA